MSGKLSAIILSVIMLLAFSMLSIHRMEIVAQGPAAETDPREDVLVIDDVNKLAFFGWYRATQMPNMGWDLLIRTMSWAVASASPYDLIENTTIVLFTYDGTVDPDQLDTEDAAAVYNYLISYGYKKENIELHGQQEVETLDPAGFDLVIYWNLYGYNSTNIVNSGVPFITVSTMQTDEMGIGTGNKTLHDHRDTFYVVNNGYYPTEQYPLGQLKFESEMWFDATEAKAKGIPLVAAEMPLFYPEIEVITIGTGQLCFSFAIFADPQSSFADLQAAVDEINDRVNSGEDIRFVMVLGDIIQGEEDTAQDYQDEFTTAKGILDGLLIPYIPVIGNHDVWCNLAGISIHIPNCSGDIPMYVDTTYPEEIFNNVFGPVYTSLATTLAGWTKQKGMPLNNPDAPPPTYFQNFAFDYGGYHFVCLDFCARDDFDPDDWKMKIDSQTVTIPKYQFGHAHVQNEYGGDGTIKWLEDHLENYGYCDPDTEYGHGYKRSKNIVFFSHHAPVFNLKGKAIVSGFNKNWELQDENTFGFHQTEYNNLVNLLNTLASNHGFNYQWFTGHYHVKDWEWLDTTISPNAQVKVIASVQPLSWAQFPSYIQVDPLVTIDNAYSVTTADNDYGQITIVQVLQPGGTDPDPSIYNQFYTIDYPTDPWGPPPPVTWDDPDIEFRDPTGTTFVLSSDLDWEVDYLIRARIYNKGCSDVTIDVKFTWQRFTPPVQTGTIGTIPGKFVPSGQEVFVDILWNTIVVSPSAGTLTVHACVKAEITSSSPTDSNSLNNLGQENCDIQGCSTAMSGEDITIPFLVENPTNQSNGIFFTVAPQKGDLWNATVTLFDPPIPPKSWGTATLLLSPLRKLETNEWDIFTVTVGRIDTREATGGFDFKVIINDPPKLDWVGDAGYASDGVEKDAGCVNEIFTYRVKYTDANNDPPKSGYPSLYIFKGDKQIQGSPFVMSEEDQTDTDNTDGRIYTFSITLTKAGDDYAYRFWARDRLGVEGEGPANIIMSGPRLPTIKEDINLDCKVNIIDITIAAVAFGSHGPDIPNPGDQPHPRWDPDADINNDGWVNIIDIAKIATKFGWTC